MAERWGRENAGGGWRKKLGEGGRKMRDRKVERGKTAGKTGRPNVAEVKEKDVERMDRREDWKRKRELERERMRVK